MSVKVVALLTMLSMSINGFLPRSITDLSGNSFLADTIACQSVFLDFLHFSDKSLVEIAIKTVDDLSVSLPFSSVDGRASFSNPWANVCRALTRSTDRLNVMGVDLAKKAVPASPKNTDPFSPSMDNTSSDYILLNNAARMDVVSRYISRGYVLTAGGVCLVVTRLLSVGNGPMTFYDVSALCSESGYPPQGTAAGMGSPGRDVAIYMAGQFTSYLPRSGIEAAVIVRGIF